MLPRFDLLFALMLALASCAPLPARPITIAVATQEEAATAVPTPTATAAAEDPNALPTADELAGWVLTTDEIKYIDSFRFGTKYAMPQTQEALFDLVNQFREDPSVLSNNQWRKAAVDVTNSLAYMSLNFSPKSPSERFAPFAGKVDEMLAHYTDAASLVQDGIDEMDGTKIESAVRQVAAATSLSVAIDTAFTALMGPPEN